jgi:hypothetical protein
MAGNQLGPFGALWERELRNSAQDAGFARQVGSVAPDFGFERVNNLVDHPNLKVTTFGNQVRGTGALSGQYIARMPGGQHQAYRSLSEASMNDDTLTSKAATKLLGKGDGVRGHVRNSIFRFVNTRNIALPLSAGFALYDGMSAFGRGEGIGGGLLAAGKGYVTGALIGKVAGATMANPIAGGIAVAAGIGMYGVYSNKEYGNAYLRSYSRSTMAGGMTPSLDTAMAATMRQRAMLSMQQSKFNAFRNLGSEASFMHQPRSRYGNTYNSVQSSPIMAY